MLSYFMQSIMLSLFQYNEMILLRLIILA